MSHLQSLIIKTLANYQSPADVEKKMDWCSKCEVTHVVLLATIPLCKTWTCEVVVCIETGCDDLLEHLYPLLAKLCY